MSEAKLVTVSISSIDPNPMRRLKRYPYNKLRLANLQGSIEDVGFFEGVHARKVGDRYQLAFGHHRIEACRKHGLKRVPLLVGDYADEEMLKMLSRENDDVGEGRMEVFQEVWEAAQLFYADELVDVRANERDAYIAKKLGGGWTIGRNTPRGVVGEMSQRSKACAKVIKLGLDTETFTGVSARTANEVVTRAASVEKKVDKAEEREDITHAKADKLRDALWEAVGEVVQTDADPVHNPGRKLGYRAALSALDEQTKKQREACKPKTDKQPKRKPIDKHADRFRKWASGVMDELNKRYETFFDAARFASDEPNTAAELHEVAAQLRRAAKAFERHANNVETINGQSRRGLRSVGQ